MQEGGGWKTSHTMKRVYTHTFKQERLDAEKRLDDYYGDIIKNAKNESDC